MRPVLLLWYVAQEALATSPPQIPLAVRALTAVDSMPGIEPALRTANGVRLAKILLRHTTATQAARRLLEQIVRIATKGVFCSNAPHAKTKTKNKQLPLVDARSPAYFEVLDLLASACLATRDPNVRVLIRPLSIAIAEAEAYAVAFHFTVALKTAN